MESLCEACERLPVSHVEPCDDADSPYRVCSACHTRLLERSLRPIEWYNLAKWYGSWPFLLHDDFYLDDGTATQPETEVDSVEDHPAPTLDDVRHDPESLLDFTITQWQVRDDVRKAWRSLASDRVLEIISRRFPETLSSLIRGRQLEVVAILGADGEAFVRKAWPCHPISLDLGSLAEASAACLPHHEGFTRVANALADLNGREKTDQMLFLSYFRSPDALDWIEENVSSPVMDNWGYLAAASHFDWPRAMRWIESGRPLSLIALDALSAIIEPRTPLLRAASPRLQLLPAPETLESVLTAHIERDSAPRVKMVTKFILRNVDRVMSGRSTT
jgi:hypothetical protein